MRCQRCGNTDPTYFYRGHNGYYCRKCIRFKRILISEEFEPKNYPINATASEYALKYTLTKAQLKASNEIIETLDNSSDVLLKCVCGAGKTELTVAAIAKYLSQKKRVIYAIARREVVIELAQRFKTIFSKAKVATLCEGYHEMEGDLIVCTTHQLYRFSKSVDLLILDEVDAFPFKGDEVLMNIALNSLSSQGRIIYSTATVDKMLEEFIRKRPYQVVSLNVRPHGYPLIEPKVVLLPKMGLYLYAIYLAKVTKQPLIIFVETKKQAKVFGKFLSTFIKATYVYSDLETRNQNIVAFKNHDYQVIVATSVLERGVTIPGVDVVILNLTKGILDEASLVQMSGRVGRTFDCPTGRAYILTNAYRKEIHHALHTIHTANEMSLLSKR